MYKLKLFFSACSISLIISCTPDSALSPETNQDDHSATTYNNVDKELWPQFKAFEDEAAKRGLSISLNQLNLHAAITEIAEQNVLGQCQYSRLNPRAVTIDKSFWKSSSALYREFVVFHELGHCVLNLGHNEDKDNRGRCLSMMRSGLSGCVDAYNAVNRDYYLNELFGSN